MLINCVKCVDDVFTSSSLRDDHMDVLPSPKTLPDPPQSPYRQRFATAMSQAMPFRPHSIPRALEQHTLSATPSIAASRFPAAEHPELLYETGPQPIGMARSDAPTTQSTQRPESPYRARFAAAINQASPFEVAPNSAGVPRHLIRPYGPSHASFPSPTLHASYQTLSQPHYTVERWQPPSAPVGSNYASTSHSTYQPSRLTHPDNTAPAHTYSVHARARGRRRGNSAYHVLFANTVTPDSYPK